ncbi:hypothetical protein GpartN1_g1502.t1 [Galdieria partita]|uniref:Adaptor protein ClpS core domain-containing protein n=1 Tax=Galdieria partita TaxID=83374 RepID=A0A9C7PSM5_9RHOD|nr:hypothetical protein GpartN1_g455.t1 [Galdieria partita]GJQ09711.1 hypothetical protein GpartN1_g1502.t1 [Galdieria partita]
METLVAWSFYCPIQHFPQGKKSFQRFSYKCSSCSYGSYILRRGVTWKVTKHSSNSGISLGETRSCVFCESNIYCKTEIGRPKPSVTGKPGKLDFSKGGSDANQAQREGRGGVAVKVKPKRKTKKEKKEELEHNWRVLLHNDDIHTFDYVITAIVSVVKTVSRKKAHRVTMEAHSCGVSTVTTTWKQLAEEYCLGLQRYGLTTSIAPDSLFKP